jgi:hypothetical protein
MAVNVRSHEALEAPGEPHRRAQVRAYARTLREDGLDEGQFQRFIFLAKEEAVASPTEIAQLVEELLQDDRLTVMMVGEVRVRARLLEVQQALGFPWALQIDPGDLVLLKPPETHVGFRWVTVIAALLTALFDGCFAMIAQHEAAIALFFIVGLLHALFVAGAAVSFASKKHLRALGWMWLCGPAFTAALMAVSHDRESVALGVVGLAFAFPSMVTACLALGLSRKAPE